MSSIQTGIELNDQFSMVLNGIISTVNLAVSAMYDMQESMNAGIDTSGIEGAREEINQATAALNAMNEALNQQAAPDAAPPEPVELPVQWETDSMDVFMGTGMERFEQEVQSANQMLHTLCATQSQIAAQAAGSDLFPPEMVADMGNMQNRLQAIQQQIQAIENNPLNMGTDSANAELEELRARLNQMVQEQEMMNQAVGNMDVSAANDAYLRLSRTVSGTERYIRDNVDEQGRFNREIQSGVQSAGKLKSMIAGAVGAFVGVAGIKKAFSFIQDCTELYNTQLNAENQLMAVLGNMLSEDYVSQFEIETTADTTAAVNEINAVQGEINEMSMPVSVESKALQAEFDAITEKASQIQGQGIYGDEAMIAGAAEFATYFSDTNAIEMMMDTLSDYAMGMSGGGALDSKAMVDYATGLGKIMTGSYEAMTKKGFEFSDAQKAIIEGSATQEQIVATLGEDYADVSSEMQSAAAISQVIEESWDGLYESMSNTPEGKIIQLSNTWGDMKEVIGGQLYPYVLLFVDTIQDNWPTIQAVVDNITMGLQFMLGFFSWLVDGAIGFAQAVIDNWSWISPIIMGIVAALGAYAGISAVIAVINGIHAMSETTKAASQAMATGTTFAETAAQYGLNAALAACPLTWIILLIIALIAVIYVVCQKIAELTGIANSGFGVITGGVNVVIQFFKNLALSVANNALGMGFAIEALASNMKTAFHNAIASVQSWLYDLLSTGLAVIAGICEALNKLPFVEFDYSGITSAADDYAAKAVEAAERKGTYKNVTDAFNKGNSTFETFQDGWAEDAFNAGAAWGDGIADAVSNFSLSDLFGIDDDKEQKEQDDYTEGFAGALDDSGVGNDIGGIAGDTSAIKDSMDITSEELKYLRDIAEQETINRFTTAEINVDMSGMQNSINNGNDIDGFMTKLTDSVNEAVDNMTEGVHA